LLPRWSRRRSRAFQWRFMALVDEEIVSIVNQRVTVSA
jgi:hypothetical protein